MEEVIVYSAEELLQLILDVLSEPDYSDTLTDGEFGNNDLEKIFMYQPELDKDIITGKYTNVTVFQEMSARMSLIDSRLQTTNDLLSAGFSFVGTFAVCLFSFKFLSWLYNVLGV